MNSGVDYINGVCPCAGLSMLNTSKTSGISRGSDAEMNKWMFQSAEYVLGRIKPKVFWGENAPGLFTTIGLGVVDGLRLVILITTKVRRILYKKLGNIFSQLVALLVIIH